MPFNRSAAPSFPSSSSSLLSISRSLSLLMFVVVFTLASTREIERHALPVPECFFVDANRFTFFLSLSLSPSFSLRTRVRDAAGHSLSLSLSRRRDERRMCPLFCGRIIDSQTLASIPFICRFSLSFSFSLSLS